MSTTSFWEGPLPEPLTGLWPKERAHGSTASVPARAGCWCKSGLRESLPTPVGAAEGAVESCAAEATEAR
eukprot:10995084-Lingulodinium_polyedra.AAC.1